MSKSNWLTFLFLLILVGILVVFNRGAVAEGSTAGRIMLSGIKDLQLRGVNYPTGKTAQNLPVN